MKYVPLTDAKANLGQYVSEIQVSGSFILTDYGQPVAILSPAYSAKSDELFLKAGIKAGILRPPVAELSSDIISQLGVIGEDVAGEASGHIITERSEGW